MCVCVTVYVFFVCVSNDQGVLIINTPPPLLPITMEMFYLMIYILHMLLYNDNHCIPKDIKLMLSPLELANSYILTDGLAIKSSILTIQVPMTFTIFQSLLVTF